jgi:acetyltransferase-like isoleucine patch superfamily enzyme
MSFYVHPTAEVSPEATIGVETRVWHQAQIRQGAKIGDQCIIGKGVYIDFDVVIGHRCKLQNGVFVYHGATLEEGVFLGPGVMVLNDKNPRAITPDGALKSDADWQVSPTYIGYGAGVGGGAIILPGVSVGKWAIIGSGAVVTRNIPDYGLVYGNPARLTGFVCPCGQRLPLAEVSPTDIQDTVNLTCAACQRQINLPGAVYHQIL